ncbi:MAG: hypothetical protein Ct9H300mP14_16040 [Gammaproteobacteria bacterium]|nr:MAG: hypothetical protein Ct9H300mP14_16040 [Gammaproteobacteria bacterium]
MSNWDEKGLDPPGDARQDLWIIQQIANRLGLKWKNADVRMFLEMRDAMPSISGMTWERLESEHSINPSM